jgi:uncharacterized protein (UPF0335 family)
MKQTAERRLQLALGQLLTNIYHNRNWSEETVINLASKAGIARTEALRFYHSLVEMNLLKFDKQRQSYVANFDVVIWSDEDAKLGLVREIMEMFPIRLRKGRVKGSRNKSAKKTKPQAKNVEKTTIRLQEEINPLSQFSSVDLVTELRSRGYEVKASKVITTVEEL